MQDGHAKLNSGLPQQRQH